MFTLLVFFASPVFSQTDSDALLRQGDLAVLQGHFDAGRDAYQSAIRAGAAIEKDSLRSRNLALCELNVAPPDFAQAIRWFQISLALDKGNEDTRLQLARTLLRIGKFDQAADQFRALASAHPESTEYAIGLSDSLRGGGKTGEALEFLHTTLARFQDNVGLRLEYARLLSYEKLFDRAREQYETVLRVQPTNLRAQVGVAKIASWQGDQEGALARYDRILEKNPSYYDAQVGKAFSLLWMGRSAEARPLLESASRRHPDDQEVIDALRSMNGSSKAPVEQLSAASHGRQTATMAPPPSRVPPSRVETVPVQRAAAVAATSVPKPSAPQPAPSASSAPANRPAPTTSGPAPRETEAPGLVSTLINAPWRNRAVLFVSIGLAVLALLRWIYVIKTRAVDTYVHDAKSNRQQHYMPHGGSDEYARLVPTPSSAVDQSSTLSLEALDGPKVSPTAAATDTPTVLDLESVFLAAELEAALDASAPDPSESKASPLPVMAPSRVAAAASETAAPVHTLEVASKLAPPAAAATSVSQPGPVPVVAPAPAPLAASLSPSIPVAATPKPVPSEAAASAPVHAPESHSPLPAYTIDFEPPSIMMAAFAGSMASDPAHSAPSTMRSDRDHRQDLSIEPPVFTALHRASRSAPSPTSEMNSLVVPELETKNLKDSLGLLSGKKVLIVGKYDECIDHEARMLRDADADVWLQPSWREGLRFMERVMVDVAIVHEAPDEGTAREIQAWVSQQRPGFDKKLIFVVSPEERERLSGLRTLVQPFAPSDLLELLVTVH